MDELSFRGKDRYRVSWGGVAAVGAGLVVEAAFTLFRMGFGWFCWLFGGTLVVVAACAALARRSVTTVGADGITVGWGLGQGRTYHWHDIRWLYVWQQDAGLGSASTVRMILTDGRHRSLTGLASSSVYPNPDFHHDFARVVQWWEASTDPAERFQPPPKLRHRVSPQILGLVIGLVVSVAVVLGVVLAHL